MHLAPLDYEITMPDGSLPDMMTVRQIFNKTKIVDVEEATRREFQKISSGTIEGRRVAITAGSRGIANIGIVMKTLVDELRKKGALPFVVPAMGSHGGGTAEGQKLVLEHYGVTEETIGAPVISSMEAVKIGYADGIPIYSDKSAFSADHIVVVNRVKAHSDFKASYESGICKMMIIGLGKRLGAQAAHSAGSGTFGGFLPKAAEIFIGTGKIMGAIALVENASEETAIIEAMKPEAIISKERKLLIKAKELQGRLLMESIDILIMDEIGKNISGAGMDPNVTGRPPTGAPGFEAPRIGQIIVRGLTECSDGNAIGVGMADVITLDMARNVELSPTYINALTAGVPAAAKIPMTANNDMDAVAFAMINLGRASFSDIKIVRIKNTLELEKIEVSSNYAHELKTRPDQFEIVSSAKPMRFSDDGYLMS
jgi:hypothetical protein